MSSELLWEPSPESVANSQLNAYQAWLESNGRGPGSQDYEALWRWSTDEPEEFWLSIWDYFDVQHDGDFERVISSHEMPGARWFEGTRVNFAEHIFRDRDPDAIAIFGRTESGAWNRDLTWSELKEAVTGARSFLRSHGVTEGDRVAGIRWVLEKEIKRGTCLKGRPMLMVMGSTPDAQGMITQSLNSGCEKQADIAREIEQQFISWPEVEPWLVAKN